MYPHISTDLSNLNIIIYNTWCNVCCNIILRVSMPIQTQPYFFNYILHGTHECSFNNKKIEINMAIFLSFLEVFSIRFFSSFIERAKNWIGAKRVNIKGEIEKMEMLFNDALNCLAASCTLVSWLRSFDHMFSIETARERERRRRLEEWFHYILFR